MEELATDDKKKNLLSLIGESLTFICAVYIYTGKLIDVNEDCIKLENCSVVFETGPFTKSEWRDAQKLPHKYWYIQMAMIESWGIMK